MHTPRNSLLVAVATALLVLGCADGDNDDSSSFGGATFPTAPPVTSVPVDTAEPTSGGGASETGAVLDTGDDTTAPPTTDEPETTAVDPSTTTTGFDPSTTAPDPSTTAPDPSTTAPDPSTTAPDPSTTEPDPSTTNMTTMPMTTMPMTTDPDPPPKDPQPTSGLYETCLVANDCTAPTACLMVTDNNTMMVYDGFCTKLCTTVANCGQAPNAPAIQKCIPFNVNQNLCVLECITTDDCPTGMICTAVTNPNNTMGNYCI